jgi:hypothetical protein
MGLREDATAAVEVGPEGPGDVAPVDRHEPGHGVAGDPLDRGGEGFVAGRGTAGLGRLLTRHGGGR